MTRIDRRGKPTDAEGGRIARDWLLDGSFAVLAMYQQRCGKVRVKREIKTRTQEEDRGEEWRQSNGK